ncbi:MAG: DUF5522 domain-containing protein [Planctomycetia bacterium]|nr:DUF5522 domain-containing protein [Planctomycetia bacterium]RLT13493.1 MAG: hypothetical protein DWI25_06920 [Planctomycetota bacterium]
MTDNESPEIPLQQPTPHKDFYLDNGLLVFTAAYHVRRGECCGSGCRHCPYIPAHVAGNQRLG